MNLLGLSFGFHDAAAALLVDGQIVAAVEEERLSRVKHDPGFPARAADTCLQIAGITPSEIDGVAFHEKPLGVVNRQLMTRVRSGPAGLGTLLLSTPHQVREQLGVGHRIASWFSLRGCAAPPVTYSEHHTSHAAAAFYPSPYGEAAVLTVDGVGESATASVGSGRGHRLQIDEELHFPDSVGILYSAFAEYCGFRVNGGEGELMGLAPFGEPKHVELILDELVHLAEDGSIELDQRYFRYLRGRRTISPLFERLFGAPARPLHSPPTAREADLAASIQVVLERVLLAMARRAFHLTGQTQLCLAGGVALNCVANSTVLLDGPFDEVWVQPAAGDAGSAVGAALYVWHDVLGNERTVASNSADGMSGAFLGPSFARIEVRDWLESNQIGHIVIEDDLQRCRVVAQRIADGDVIGWFGGRMEFGPRALGHRSILADARSPSVQRRINSMVKERAAFRPFAPAVLADRAAEWFELDRATPYMTFTAQVREEQRVDLTEAADPDDLETIVSQVRSTIPAVTHVDGSARVQTVDDVTNPEFAMLIRSFDELTGCPVILNTSFNARDEPIVCTPDDAFRTFVRTGLDLLVIEDCLIERAT